MTAIVTGGTRGIGLACCRLFARAGYRVVALWAHDEAAAAAARTALPEVEFVRVDVSREEEVAALFAGMGAVDVLVNNAGISHIAQIQDVSWETFRRVTDVNLGGVFLTCKYAVRKMLARGGAIVNLSSIWGVTGGSCESVYSATKGGIVAFSKALAKELAPASITVNCVAPGVIETTMNAQLSAEERRDLCEAIPLGRFGNAEEVAQAVYYLATARYVTGQVLGVDGGGIA